MQLETGAQPYVLAKLEEATRMIKQAANDLPLIRSKLEKHNENKIRAREIYADLQTHHFRLCNAFNAAALSLHEMESNELAETTSKLGQSLKKFNLMTPDYTKLCGVLKNYLSQLPLANEEKRQTTNAAVIGRLMSHVKMGYYPTDLDHMNMIARGIEPPESAVSLLDPCCGCGLALQRLGETLSENGTPITTYGIELDDYRAEESLTRLNRVGFGSFYHSRISRDAFHAMLLNPPYLSVMSPNGNNTRSEKRFLAESIANLMLGGLLIYIIPYYRADSTIARILADNFTDITMWRFMGEEFKRFKQVVIMGTRIKKIDGSTLAPALAALALTPNEIPPLSDLPTGCYSLPNKDLPVASFKGSKFNVPELQRQLSQSKSFAKLFERNKLDSMEKRPLLPLNLSQIGLIGGSGHINGLVADPKHPHLLKGRIVKSNKAVSEDNYNSRGDLMSTTTTVVRSNKMIFNILTPQGFISLTDYTTGAEHEATDSFTDDEPGEPPLRVLPSTDGSIDDGDEVSAEKKKEEILEIIRYADCSESYHKFSAFEHFPVATSNVIRLAEAAGCYWFLDIIGSYQTDKRLDPNFQIWELKVNLEDNSAVAHGYNDTNKLIITQEIPYTDFPLDSLTLYMENGVILFPSER